MTSIRPSRFWATSIVLYQEPASPDGTPRWFGAITFHDERRIEDDIPVSTGEIRTGNSDTPSAVIDTLLVDAASVDIRFRRDPILCYLGDGEDPHYPPPRDWRDILTAEAVRIGWRCTWPGPWDRASSSS